MLLKELKISGWRNYTGEKVNLSPGINLFLGNNGQGKTNLLEAIYYLCSGRSPRTGKLEELINWHNSYFFLAGDFDSRGNVVVEMGAAKDGRRINKVNGAPLKRVADISDYVNAIIFIPEDLELAKGSPAQRRRFLDLEIGQVSSSYRYQLQNYRKYVKERNALLKEKTPNSMVLEVLTTKVAELSQPIAVKREDFIKKLSMLSRLMHRKLSRGQEELTLSYKPSLDPSLPLDQRLSMFKRVSGLEQRYKSTMLGPHKDDFEMFVNKSNLRTYGSQGQQRTAVLSIKLAEIELLKSETGEYPLLLLDDVFSELDDRRKKMLLDYLSHKVQTFITSTEDYSDHSNSKSFWIEAGQVKRVKRKG